MQFLFLARIGRLFLNSLLFDTYSSSENLTACWEASSRLTQSSHQAHRNQENILPCDRLLCNKIINWFGFLNFWDQSFVIWGSKTNFSCEFELPTSKFHEAKKCSKIPFLSTILWLLAGLFLHLDKSEMAYIATHASFFWTCDFDTRDQFFDRHRIWLLSKLCWSRSRQTSPYSLYSLWAECAGCLRTSSGWRSGRSATGGAWGERWSGKRDQWRGRTAHIMSACGWDDKWTQDSRFESSGACAMYEDALTQDERDKAHWSVRVDVLCGENSHGCHVVIGVVIVHHHPATVVEFSLLVHLCTCGQTVWCDRQFFLVAIYCTLLHRENGSFEVLCLHLPRRLQ